MPFIPVFDRNTTRALGHPKGAEQVRYVDLAEALTTSWGYDAHFGCYSNPDESYRLAISSDVEPNMVLAVFDVDDPVAHENDTPARPEWIEDEARKIATLREDFPGLMYATRGGYRLVFLLPQPVVAAGWTRTYKAWVNYLAAVYDIRADARCADWPHCFRLPNVLRNSERQAPTLVGDPNNIGIWDPPLEAEDWPSNDLEPTAPSNISDTYEGPSTLEERTAWAAEFAASAPPAISGKGGHNALYTVTASVYRGFGLPRSAALHVLCNTYNPRCAPPWSTAEIEHKLDSVERLPAGDLAQAAELARDLSPAPIKHKYPSDNSHPKADEASATFVRKGDPAVLLDAQRDASPPVPSGLQAFDDSLRGGWRFRRLAVLGGAPEAGKTTFAVNQAVRLAQRGIPVVYLAADETEELIAVRLGQYFGGDRDALERGQTPNDVRSAIQSIPLDILAGQTVDAAAAYLASWVAARGAPGGVLVVDSIQTAMFEATPDERYNTDELVVGGMAKRLRALAETKNLLILATSAISREYYKSYAEALEKNPLAAFRSSGQIESEMSFGALLLTPPDGAGKIVFRIAKNRNGRGHRTLGFAIDSNRSAVVESDVPTFDKQTERENEPPPDPEAEMRVIWSVIKRTPEIRTKHEIRDAVRSMGLKMRNDRVNIAIAGLLRERRIERRESGFAALPWPLDDL